MLSKRRELMMCSSSRSYVEESRPEELGRMVSGAEAGLSRTGETSQQEQSSCQTLYSGFDLKTTHDIPKNHTDDIKR
jgi:hypothetical protein